jgi:hypothetical protein
MAKATHHDTWTNPAIALFHGTTDNALESILGGVNVNTQQSKGNFWRVVIECLVTFHRWPRQKAQGAVANYKTCVSSRVNKSEFELIYHEEPFAIANEIADECLDISKSRAAYEAILEKQDW